jgi:hypothetical protein
MKPVTFKLLLPLLLVNLVVMTAGCSTGDSSSSPAASTAAVAPLTTPASTPIHTTTPVSSTPVPTTSTLPATTANPTPLYNAGQATPMTRWQYTVYRFRNLVAFDAVHKGTVFQVSGMVKSIVQGGPYVVIDDGSLPSSYTFASEWMCYFQTDESLLNRLKVGQIITVAGTWGRTTPGGLKEDPVRLDNCDLVS